jgi:hypothetical protein
MATSVPTAWNPNQLAALESALASGATSVSYEGKTVQYRSLDEMLRLRMYMMIALGLITPPSSTILAGWYRGYPGFGSVASQTLPFGIEIEEGEVVG